ncbi:HPr kinase/phosphorylase [bacterium HR40]|nr:HPr kinase/phosphorylase [bacterium HR40]
MPAAAGRPLRRHGCCVLWRGRGLFIRGRSGAGKSALVLRLLAHGAWLVADDLVELRAVDGCLHACAPSPRGHLEVRGLGLFRLVGLAGCRIHLVVEVSAARRARLPEPREASICGVPLPEVTIDAASPTALARIELALFAMRVL